MVAVSSVNNRFSHFSQKEIKNFKNIITQYKENPNNRLKTQIVDMYTPFIQRKAERTAMEKGISSKDYVQELYLRLLENLDFIVHNRKAPIISMSLLLSRTQPSINTTIYTGGKSIKGITPREEYVYASEEPADIFANNKDEYSYSNRELEDLFVLNDEYSYRDEEEA